ncbi:hypothetical protein CONLIGDRAFT_277640 [Coniochaeta ligniaria NRRL 30616]|uniref:Uncharacterized protein n=1 Tax=Coniochaeta ligniaria NRRL 30616 TaxID=1408157 RepID=A0A1J7JY49_9PEZI|nr:hypothetical protein CONLIGDRAFT_277640 [Coniochaeta ligniaria NRRL 30616]
MFFFVSTSCTSFTRRLGSNHTVLGFSSRARLYNMLTFPTLCASLLSLCCLFTSNSSCMRYRRRIWSCLTR